MSFGFGLGAGRKVTVVGAGFSGLVSAYALVRAGYRVTVLEAASQPGGLIQTLKLEEGLVETAANALLNSNAVEELFTATGVEMVGTLKAAKKRYIFKNGRARRWPLGFAATLRVLGFGIRYVFSRQSLAPRAGESAHDWAERVMGAEASAYLIEAALQGIYAGDPRRMSATLIFARLFSKKRDAVLQSAGMAASGAISNSSSSSSGTPFGCRSLLPHDSPHRVRPKQAKRKGSVTPAHGMGDLIHGLVSYLKAKGVGFEFGRSVTLTTSPDHPHVVATSGHAAADLLATLSPSRSAILRRIEFSPVVTTTAFYDGTDSKSRGFGVLFPPVEKRKALGVLKNNFIFRNRVKRGFSETWILGGALSSTDPTRASDAEILARICEERRESFGREDQLLASKTTRWEKGIPHYTLELERNIGALQGFDNNVILMGNYLGELGLAKILDRALRLPLQISTDGQWATGSSQL